MLSNASLARPRTIVYALLLFTAAPLALTAQVPADAADRVDEIFAPWASETLPGCAVGVSENGRTLLARAYGMADLEWGIPNTPETIFEGGSLSKQFTSAAVVLLALEGKLSLDDDVRTYIPELPDYGSVITVRRLMNHTSGLRDWGSVAEITGWGREERTHDHADVLEILSHQSALNYPPGDQYSYTNSGYNLLAMIVDRVSGMPFAQFSMERLFRPLGLEHTQWRDDYQRLVPGRSTAYNVRGDGDVRINRPIENVHGNGGILTTVGDLLKWDAAIAEGRGLGGQAFVDLMEHQGTLNDGSRIVYASGLRIEDFYGVPSVSHTGSTSGYRAFLGRYPDQGLSVAMLCNASNAPTGGNGGRVALAFLGDRATPPVPPAGVEVAGAALEALAGRYRERLTGSIMDLSVRDGALRAGGGVLIPLSATEFARGAGDTRYVFDTSGEGRPTLRVHSWEVIEQVWEPVEPVEPTPSELEAYVGSYYGPDADVTFEVSVADGRLVLSRRPDDTWTALPIYADGFRAGGRILRFHRQGGAVTGFSFSIGRVFDMRFQRVDG